jgi:hypothetical protein
VGRWGSGAAAAPRLYLVDVAVQLVELVDRLRDLLSGSDRRGDRLTGRRDLDAQRLGLAALDARRGRDGLQSSADAAAALIDAQALWRRDRAVGADELHVSLGAHSQGVRLAVLGDVEADGPA